MRATVRFNQASLGVFVALPKALLVDDEYINRQIGTLLLEKVGLHVDLAVCGEDALAMTATEHYALVLMDLQMPGMGGIEATQHIRAREQRDSADRQYMVGVTATGGKEVEKRCLNAGMDTLIVKPLQTEIITSLLQRSTPGNSSGKIDAANTAGSRVWNRAKALHYLGGDEALLQELVQLFLHRKQTMLGAIDDALHAVDSEAVSGAAHAFKGAVNHFAAGRCQRLALLLEKKAEKGWLDELHDYFNELCLAADSLEESLRQQL